ncbi:MAG: hypothetical protein NVSMB32_08620 [Actinomycetota bacterium]
MMQTLITGFVFSTALVVLWFTAWAETKVVARRGDDVVAKAVTPAQEPQPALVGPVAPDLA